jgi:hypothetical protein
LILTFLCLPYLSGETALLQSFRKNLVFLLYCDGYAVVCNKLCVCIVGMYTHTYFD